MVQGKAIPKPVQWIIVRLGTTMSVEGIAMYTDVGQRTVKKILSHFRQTGQVPTRKSVDLPALHRTLCDHDVEVGSFYSIMLLSSCFLGRYNESTSSCLRLSIEPLIYTLKS